MVVFVQFVGCCSSGVFGGQTLSALMRRFRITMPFSGPAYRWRRSGYSVSQFQPRATSDKGSESSTRGVVGDATHSGLGINCSPGPRSKPGIPPDAECDSRLAIQSHEFIQRFLANERQLDLEAEAERAHLAALVREVRRPSRRLLLAQLAAVFRRGDVRGIDGRSTAWRSGAAKDQIRLDRLRATSRRPRPPGR
jgi:hypothetical protein